MSETRADPVELAVLSRDSLNLAKGLRTALSAARAATMIKAAAFGNAEGAEAFGEAHEKARTGAGTAFENLAEVCEGDTDRLLRIAFSYRQTDLEQALNLHLAGREGKP
ncbi:hypothetical protein Afil01_35310 [Actinorhabdospora filicis]|uniref:Uncharacterized protein n=1 Tax=Actinorhabdospora filicis TaxID=1785913 RepID=A0A9W6W9K2_9ACTN|nr:hypothetical protein [Actinorhabdospora filicis]GLZ78724.1 hypothetical protein Afil01_35310 [Actinorhabdospora filicis]